MGNLTTAQAATLLGLTVRRIRQLCECGELHGSRRFGRDWLIPERSVRAWKPGKKGWPLGKPRKATGRKAKEDVHDEA